MLKPTVSSATFSLKVKLGLASNLPGYFSKRDPLRYRRGSRYDPLWPELHEAGNDGNTGQKQSHNRRPLPLLNATPTFEALVIVLRHAPEDFSHLGAHRFHEKPTSSFVADLSERS